MQDQTRAALAVLTRHRAHLPAFENVALLVTTALKTFSCGSRLVPVSELLDTYSARARRYREHGSSISFLRQLEEFVVELEKADAGVRIFHFGFTDGRVFSLFEHETGRLLGHLASVDSRIVNHSELDSLWTR